MPRTRSRSKSKRIAAFASWQNYLANLEGLGCFMILKGGCELTWTACAGLAAQLGKAHGSTTEDQIRLADELRKTIEQHYRSRN